jgi:hypothetical protein
LLLGGCQRATDPARARNPDMVGATSAPLFLGKEPTRIDLAIHQPTGAASPGADVAPRRVYLHIENITSDEMAPSYDVYLNVPPGDAPEKRPDLHVGGMAMFGLVEASLAGRDEPDHGLTYMFDVTGVYRRLVESGSWDDERVHVSFVPTRWNDPVRVRVGRISLHIE